MHRNIAVELRQRGFFSMIKNGNPVRIDTTLGELIAALSEAAFQVSQEKKEAYLFVALALQNILRGTARRKLTAEAKEHVGY